ncbi:bifunctional methylenetetrahydrofolate dehydrogenase/methenyltetrahydrofolate cyclohydrolase FolD [Fusobacterium sp. PH5-44]|uniref:bifunctional methylenetetrahydrofolate dehydrogenase/methenyltetrahydrofolate cyclohydrolase FolD n=1 Tax=unclassified Fusobacterium TaxID=2648384 RepID=UPI003D1FFBD3
MKIIDGKEKSKKIKEELKFEIETYKSNIGKVPGLAVIIVGENPASQIYVNSKIKSCEAIGMRSHHCLLKADITEEELLNKIEEYNINDDIDGILVQLPLPRHIDEKKVIDKIALNKDVDGFKPENLGLLFLGDKDSLKPCTPAGIMELLEEYKIEIKGKNVIIIGRSNIVGKPMAGFMINASGTVTVCNSYTKNIENKIKEADILVVAMGKKKYIKKHMVKDDVVIIDVGINRDSEGICGDVDFEDVKSKVSYITPVPGGVGPMTIAMLLKNTLKAFKKNKNI